MPLARMTPVAGHELVEARDVHGLAAIVDEGGDAVLLGLALVVVMVVMLVVVMLVVVVVIVVIVVVVALDFIDPCG